MTPLQNILQKPSKSVKNPYKTPKLSKTLKKPFKTQKTINKSKKLYKKPVQNMIDDC
jgi:hypothetical protein